MINYYKLLELERIRYCDLFLNAPTAPNVLKHTNGKCANPNFEKKEIDYSKKEPPPLSPTTQHYRTQKAMRDAKKQIKETPQGTDHCRTRTCNLLMSYPVGTRNRSQARYHCAK
jgi:hypothetical protein